MISQSGGILAQIPQPTYPIEAWTQAVIVVIFAVFFFALLVLVFAGFRWLLKLWGDDAKKRDDEWRSFFTALSSGTVTDIADMRRTAENLQNALDQLISLQSQHDTRSVAVTSALDAIKRDVAALMLSVSELTRSRGKTDE